MSQKLYLIFFSFNPFKTYQTFNVVFQKILASSKSSNCFNKVCLNSNNETNHTENHFSLSCTAPLLHCKYRFVKANNNKVKY